MHVYINDQCQQLDASIQTLSDLLQHLGIRPGSLVIERSGALFRSDQFAQIRIADGDVLNLIRFMGGG